MIKLNNKVSVEKALRRYMGFKAIEADCKKEREIIESDLFGDFKNKTSGKILIAGVKLSAEISYGESVSVDQDIVADFEKRYDVIPFRKKFELDKKMFDSLEKLNPEAHDVFSSALTYKPKKPELKIKGE